MGCCGAREKPDKILDTQKWDYINLSDFRSASCIPPFSYGILFISFIFSIGAYVIDVFTAAQLMMFDRWSGKIQPFLDIKYSRWIFLGCIIASWLFLVYRFWKARRAFKSGGIAQSYLDPLAVRLQSARVGNGRGWRRFLVFAEMTKGKKGADYVALFTYFSFEAWYRIIFAEGPRNVINLMTIVSVVKSDLLPSGKSDLSPIMQFLLKVKILADGDKIRAAVLIGMIFVVITWVLAAIGLILSCLFYIFFLWHHIPQGESLRGYCKRKVDSRLSKIVDVKVTKALHKADAEQAKQHMRAGRAGESIADIKKQPTLPVLEPGMSLNRQNTQTSMGSYASDLRQPTLPSLDGPPQPFMKRSDTMGSASSYASHASNSPLMGEAGPMGFSAPQSYSPAPSRPYTPGSQSGSGRVNTNMSNGSSRLMSLTDPNGRFTPGPPRSNTPRSNPGFGAYHQGRSSPAPGYRPNIPPQEFEMRSQTPGNYPNRGNTQSPFQSPQTQRNFTSPTYPPQQQPPSRNFSSPVHYGGPPRSGYDDSIYDHY
jgi:Fungal potassium channel